MTPLPKRKHSTRRSGKRKASQFSTLPNLSACSNCGEFKPAHEICPKCGFYNGKQVLKAEKPRKEKTK